MHPRPKPAVIIPITVSKPATKVFGIVVNSVQVVEFRVCYHPEAGHWLEYTDGKPADELASQYSSQIERARDTAQEEYQKRQAISTRHQKRKQIDNSPAFPPPNTPPTTPVPASAITESGKIRLREMGRTKQPSSTQLAPPPSPIPIPAPQPITLRNDEIAGESSRSEVPIIRPATGIFTPKDPVEVFADERQAPAQPTTTTKTHRPSTILRQDPVVAARLKQLQETSNRIKRHSELLVVGLPVAAAIEVATAAAVDAAVAKLASKNSAISEAEPLSSSARPSVDVNREPSALDPRSTP